MVLRDSPRDDSGASLALRLILRTVYCPGGGVATDIGGRLWMLWSRECWWRVMEDDVLSGGSKFSRSRGGGLETASSGFEMASKR